MALGGGNHMKHKLLIVLGSLGLVSLGIGLGYVINPTDTIRIIEQAQILQNGSVLESDEVSFKEETDVILSEETTTDELVYTDESLTTVNEEDLNEEDEITEELVIVHELPIITINGESVVYMESVDHYTELGAQAYDEDGHALEVSISGSVNRDCACEQILTYTATDAYGQSVSTNRTVIVSHPNFPSFESFSQDSRSLSLGQTVTFVLSDTTRGSESPVSRLSNVWISLKGNNGDFIDIPMVSKDETSVTLSYTYASTLPSTSYQFNGIYMSIERINSVEVNVNWNIRLDLE